MGKKHESARGGTTNNRIDTDAVFKMVFCIIFSSLGLGFYISWILKCQEDPLLGDQLGLGDIVYSWSSCGEFSGFEFKGWAVPALSYCFFYAFNMACAMVTLLALCCVSQCLVRTMCILMLLAVIAIVFMDVISTVSTWRNTYPALEALSEPKEFIDRYRWQTMFLQLCMGSAQLFLYMDSIWDAWWRNQRDRSYDPAQELAKTKSFERHNQNVTRYMVAQ